MKNILKLLIPTVTLGLISCTNPNPKDTFEEDFEEDIETTRQILLNNIDFTNEVSDALGIYFVFDKCVINAVEKFEEATNKTDLELIVSDNNKCLANKLKTTFLKP